MLTRQLCMITLLLLFPSEADAVQAENPQTASLDSLLIANRKPLTLMGTAVIDLRPLRPLAHQDMIGDLSEGWRNLIFQADMLLIVGGGRTGSYTIAYGED